MEKIRLDICVKNKLNISRTEAARLVSEGYVKCGGRVITKPSYLANPDETEIDERGLAPYCGRGGLKLEKALNEFEIDLRGKVCLDIGASTGGFTDCMLKRGASKVYAVDVGSSQLAESLRADSRVVSTENTNILDIEGFGEPIDFVGCDVSFVSLTKILAKAYELGAENCRFVFLIKPQFEAGKGNIGKGGICKDPKIHLRAVKNVLAFAEGLGFRLLGLTHSPIKGGSGNIEYLMYASKQGSGRVFSDIYIKEEIKRAAAVLKEK